MSGPQDFNQAVSVFHFTSKVSSAKIRKYRLATEKGMGPPGNAPEATTSNAPPGSNARSNSSNSQEPPAKKPRLRLNVRKPSVNDGDTIAVSRPKRASAGRRYSEDAVESDDEDASVKNAQSPGQSSGLSTLDSASASVKDGAPVENAKRGDQRESYGDFMSYYILDGDDPEEEPAPTPAPAPTTKAAPAPVVAQVKETPVRKKRGRKSRAEKAAESSSAPSVNPKPSSTRPPSDMPPPPSTHRRASASRQPPLPAPVTMPARPPVPPHARPVPRTATQVPTQPPPPIPQPEPTAMEEITVKYHASIAEKVKKLQALSAALTNFGGVPSAGAKPPASAKEQPAKGGQISKKKNGKHTSNFSCISILTDIAIAEVPVDNFLAMFDDDSDSREDQDSEPEPEPEPETTQFLERTGEPDGPLIYGIQFIMNALKSWAQQRLHQEQVLALQKSRMPPPSNARDQRAAGGPSNERQTSSNQPSPPKQLSLSDTPEGKAIQAFREVVESGCLQVNVRMPEDLASAVRHLYMQIDHLINQGSKAPPEPWQCMPYIVQIEAHRSRVEKWRDQQQRAHEEIARQQQFQPQHMLPIGGLPFHNGHAHHSNSQQQRRPSDRRRSVPHGSAQSHNHHPGRVSLPAGATGSSSYMVNGHPVASPSASQAGAANVPGQAAPGHQGAGTPDGVRLDRMQMYMPNVLPRSGHKLKFSFAPKNQAAIHAFGPEAFPAMSQGQVSRGPVSASPVVKNESAAVPMSEEPAARSTEKRTGNHQERHDTRSAEPRPSATPAYPTTSGFTAVNAPGKSAANRRRSSTAPKDSHPDAVVLDD